MAKAGGGVLMIVLSKLRTGMENQKTSSPQGTPNDLLLRPR